MKKNLEFLILSFLLALMLIGCKFKENSKESVIKKPEIVDSIPKDAVKMRFGKFIYLPILLNDSISVEAMFDSGAPGFPIMDSSLAEKFIFTFERYYLPYSFLSAPNTKIKISQQKTHIKIGSYEISDFFGVCPLTIRGYNMNAMLGYECFKNKILEIDYQKQYMRISDTVNCNLQAIPIQLIKGYLVVDVQFTTKTNKKFIGKFIIDTGCTEFMMIPKEKKLAEFITTATPDTFKKALIYGYNNTGNSFCLVDKIEIGNTVVKSSVIEITNRKGLLLDGLIGNQFLKNFKVIIDLKKNLLFLAPKEKEIINKGLNRTGIWYFVNAKSKNEKFIISGVLEGTNAEKAGFNIGDIVLEINNTNANKLSPESISELIRTIPSGKLVNYKLKRDNKVIEKQLLLDDNFFKK